MFVSEMPQEMEQEEEHDEEDSSFDLDDVEKFLNEDDGSVFVLEEDEFREVLASEWKQKRQKFQRKNCVQGLEDRRNRRQLLRRETEAENDM